MPCPAFGLGPAVAAARAVRRIQLLRDDPSSDSRQADRSTASPAGLEMLDKADEAFVPCLPGQHLSAAAPCARTAARRAGPSRPSNKKVECEEDQIIRSRCSDNAACRAAKSGAPLLSSATISPSMMAVREAGRPPWRWRRISSVQSRPLRVLQRGPCRLRPQLNAIAIELDLVRPSLPGGRALDASQSWGAMKSGGATSGVRPAFRPTLPGAFVRGEAVAAVPHRIRLRPALRLAA